MNRFARNSIKRFLSGGAGRVRQTLDGAACRLRRACRGRAVAVALFSAAALTITVVAAGRLKLVSVADGKSPPKSLLTMRSTPSTVLKQCGKKVSGDDAVELGKQTESERQIQILRALKVMVTADGVDHEVHIAKGTVADALEKADVELGKDDLLDPSAETPVKEDMHIVVRRISYKYVQKTQPVKCSYTKERTPLLKRGDSVVRAEGRNGEYKLTYRRKFLDGKQTEERLVEKVLTKKPKSGVIWIGSALQTPISRLEPGGMVLTSRGEPRRYSKCLTGIGTCYTYRGSKGTATGRKLRNGIVAVDPELIPYGTRLYITSADGSFVYGNAVAADTGGFVHNGSGRLIDLFFESESEARQFGMRKVKVYVLD